MVTTIWVKLLVEVQDDHFGSWSGKDAAGEL